MRSRYDLMEFSDQRDNEDRFYPDFTTLPTHKFVFDEAPERYILTERDIERIDLLMARKLGLSELDDIVLFINNIPNRFDLEAGDEILIPTKNNLERFFNRYFS